LRMASWRLASFSMTVRLMRRIPFGDRRAFYHRRNIPATEKTSAAPGRAGTSPAPSNVEPRKPFHRQGATGVAKACKS
jgi:hypothetical protein